MLAHLFSQFFIYLFHIIGRDLNFASPPLHSPSPNLTMETSDGRSDVSSSPLESPSQALFAKWKGSVMAGLGPYVACFTGGVVLTSMSKSWHASNSNGDLMSFLGPLSPLSIALHTAANITSSVTTLLKAFFITATVIFTALAATTVYFEVQNRLKRGAMKVRSKLKIRRTARGHKDADEGEGSDQLGERLARSDR